MTRGNPGFIHKTDLQNPERQIKKTPGTYNTFSILHMDELS